MRIIRYIGNDAICKAFSKQTGITWTTGMTATVLDDKVAAEMLKHPTVFVDASNASDPVSAQAAAIAAVGERLIGPAFYAIPSGFDWEPPVKIWRVGSELKTDFNPQTWMAPAVNTLWVSISRGNDTTGNGSFSTPYKSIWKAISVMTAATTIYVEAGVYDRNNCWKATSPQHDVNIISVGGTVVSSMRWEGGTWTPVAGGAYQATRSTVGMVVDKEDRDEFGIGRRLKKVSNQAACEAEAGTWATDNVSVWVHTTDGRSPDTSVLVMIDLANGYIAHDKKIFLQGIELEGGQYGALTYSSGAVSANTQVVASSCKFTYSKGNGHGASGVGLVIENECMAFGNLMDGFNYHQGANTVNVKAIEIGCTAYANGDPTDAADNDNGSTSHEACRVVRIGTVASGNSGPQFADVDQAMSWNINCVAWASAAKNVVAQNTGIQALGTAKVWLDGCTSVGSTAQSYASATAQMLKRGGDVGALAEY